MDDLARLEAGIFHPVEQPLAGTEQDWNDVEHELVDHARGERLADRGGAARYIDPKPVGRCCRALERDVEPFSHEVERRPAVHLDWLVRIVGQNEHRRVIWRLVSPPSPPLAIPAAAVTFSSSTGGIDWAPSRAPEPGHEAVGRQRGPALLLASRRLQLARSASHPV